MTIALDRLLAHMALAIFLLQFEYEILNICN
jgi:hypothetical protein